MTSRTTPQADGTPVWLDFWCADIEKTAAFWRDLMGYDIPAGSPDFGGYTVAHKDDTYVFGLGPQYPGSQHDMAALYFATADVEASVAKAKELGGELVIEPADIPEHGRMAVVRDPAGLILGLWQATGVVGYGAVDEPGFPCWQDCITPDLQKSKDFMAGLFGFTYTDEMGPDNPVGRLGDDQHFSMGTVGQYGDPCWLSYLLVDDIEAMIDKAKGLGAQCPKGPQDLPFGRWAHLTTPGGAPFGFFETNQQDQQA